MKMKMKTSKQKIAKKKATKQPRRGRPALGKKPMSGAERARRLVERYRQLGYTRISVWVPAADVGRITKYAKRLCGDFDC